MNIYFEISKAAAESKFGGHRYLVQRDYNDALDRNYFGFYRVAAFSDRVWREMDDGKVGYLKHRHVPNATVDLKEFLWVKLSSIPVDEILK